MFLTTQALVLREVTYKESDKILTLFSKEVGKITATARGCRKRNSPLSAGCQQLFWSQFVLSEHKGRWWVKEVAIEHEFQYLPQDFARFSLANYFAEVGEVLAIEDVPQEELLTLLLNCLYVLDSRLDLPISMIKSVFELRVACESGYEPLVDTCSICQKPQPTAPQLSFLGGTIHCRNCGGRGFPLSTALLETLRYLVSAPPKEIFHFQLDQLKDLATLSEGYLLSQLDCQFPTLAYYHQFNSSGN